MALNVVAKDQSSTWFFQKSDSRVVGRIFENSCNGKSGKGKANDAVVTLLADTLKIPKQDVTLSSGASSPRKVFKISGLSHYEIKSRLSEPDV